jgi:hypothetical protein
MVLRSKHLVASPAWTAASEHPEGAGATFIFESKPGEARASGLFVGTA